MSASRRRFLQAVLGGAALWPGTALSRRRDREIGRSITLPPWTYGNGSHCTDTVLMFRGNPSHTHYGTGPIPDRPRMHWSFRMEDFATTLRGQPIVWSGTGWTGQPSKLGDYVFVGSVGRNVYAFDARTGQVAWHYQGKRMFKSSLCIFENRLYIGNTDDYLRCIDAATGTQVWRLNTGNDCDSSPCVVDGKLYVCGEAGYARCLDPRSGEVLWKTFLGGIGPGTLAGSNGSETSPAIADGEMYAATYDGILYCLDIQDGSVKWKAQTGDDTDVSPVVWGEFVYTAAEERAPYLYCFSRRDGKKVWQYDDRLGYWSTPAVRDGKLWIGGQDGYLHCLDARTGQRLWAVKTGRAVWTSPCVVDDKVVFGSYDSHLYILEAATGKEIFRHDMGGRCISTPCIVDGTIYIGNAAGTFYCFGA